MRLIGLSCALPRKKVSWNVALQRFPQPDVERLVNNIGVLEHREAPPGMTSGDLALAAAQTLLDKLGWERESIDALVFVTQSPDYYFPGTSHRLHAELKLSLKTMCLDLNLGCSGFTHGLIVVHSLMAAGEIKRALLLCGEVTTGSVRPGVEDVVEQFELGNALLFGDAGSAAALEATGAEQYRGGAWGADGSGRQFIMVPGGGFKEFVCQTLLEKVPDEEGHPRRPIDLRVNAAAMFTSTIRRVPPLIDEALKKAGWQTDDVDAWLFYQGNKFILEFMRKRLKLPAEKVPYTLQEFGNTSSASIPLTMITRMAEQLQRPTKSLMVGFGPGLSWSAVAMLTDKVFLAPLVEV